MAVVSRFFAKAPGPVGVEFSFEVVDVGGKKFLVTGEVDNKVFIVVFDGDDDVVVFFDFFSIGVWKRII